MAMRGYEYQYDTNPRKIRPEYTTKRKKTNKKHNAQKQTQVNKNKKSETSKSKQEDLKHQKRLITKTKFSIFVKCAIIFAVVFLILFRNSQINEKFSKIQSLKTEISSLQKENDQIEINIQNSMNTNNLEQQAKVLLGMQKLTNKQIVYINIPKKDYVELKVEEIKMVEEEGLFKKILDKIKELF